MSDDDWRAYPITSGLLAEILDGLMGVDGYNMVVQRVHERKIALNRLASVISEIGDASAELKSSIENQAE